MNVRAAGEQVGLRFLGRHIAIANQIADGHRGTSGSTRFAVDIDFSAALWTCRSINFNTFSHMFDAGWIEVDRGEPKLFDVVLSILFGRAWILLAHVDHRRHPCSAIWATSLRTALLREEFDRRSGPTSDDVRGLGRAWRSKETSAKTTSEK